MKASVLLRRGVLLAALVTLCACAAPRMAPRVGAFANLPDWNGIWISEINDVDISGYPAAGTGGFRIALLGQPGTGPQSPPYRKEFADQLAARLPAIMAADALRKADGWGYPMMMEGIAPLQFLVTPEETLILNIYRDIRHIYTDGRPHMPEEERWPMPWGESIGHWDGDTLVIDTVSVQKQGAILGLPLPPLTEDAHFVERIRRTGPDRIEVQMTIEDPAIMTGPWVVTRAYRRARELDRMFHNAYDNDRSVVEGDHMSIAPAE